jgi:hypothetical protein
LDIELSKCPDIRMRGYRLFVYTKEAFFLVDRSRDELWGQFFRFDTQVRAGVFLCLMLAVYLLNGIVSVSDFRNNVDTRLLQNLVDLLLYVELRHCIQQLSITLSFRHIISSVSYYTNKDAYI